MKPTTEELKREFAEKWCPYSSKTSFKRNGIDYVPFNQMLSDLNALLDKLMPTEEDVKEHIISRYGKAYNEFEDGLIQGDGNGCEWFRGCMKGEGK